MEKVKNELKKLKLVNELRKQVVKAKSKKGKQSLQKVLKNLFGVSDSENSDSYNKFICIQTYMKRGLNLILKRVEFCILKGVKVPLNSLILI